MGKYEGMRYAKGKYPDDNIMNFFEGTGPYVPTGAGAESMDDVAVRLKSFLDETVRPLDGKVDKILCVTHSFVLKTLVREFAGDSASDAAKKPLQKNCCVHVLEYKDGRFSVKETGRTYYNPENFETVPEPLMVAHRGFGNRSSWRPESSRPAYSNSVSTACDIVKLDLQSTKYGVIVMSHDKHLKRLMNWDVRITEVGDKLGIQFLSWDGEDLDVFRNRHNKFFGTCPVGKAVYVDTAYHKTVYHEVALDELDTVLQWMLTRKPNDIPYAFDADFCYALPIC
jgi:broad specificity phosphatase PhoE